MKYNTTVTYFFIRHFNNLFLFSKKIAIHYQKIRREDGLHHTIYVSHEDMNSKKSPQNNQIFDQYVDIITQDFYKRYPGQTILIAHLPEQIDKDSDYITILP